MVELVHETEGRPPQQRSAFVRQAAAFLAGDAHRAAIGPLQQSGQMQQGRLAGARWPDQRHQLARPQRQIDAVEHGQLDPALAEHAPHPGQLQHRCGLAHS